jgi:general secretion pathway protein H
MTLIEIIISLGIVAGLIGFAATYIGNSPTNLMRDEAGRLMRVVKYVYYQAAQQSRYYRIVFDLDNQTYLVESSDSPFYIVREGDAAEELRKKNEENNKDDSDLLSENNDDGGEAAPPPPPSSGEFAESEDDLLDLVTLPAKIKISDIFVMHQKEKLAEGKAYLYFFPRGQSEFAVIHFADVEKEDKTLTLIVNPLNGTAEVRKEYVDHEDILSDMEKDDL